MNLNRIEESGHYVLRLPREDVLAAWQGWRLNEHGPFYVIPNDEGKADVHIGVDCFEQGIPGDKLIDSDHVEDEHITRENLTTYYWWRDLISLRDSIELDVDGQLVQIDLKWISHEQWQVLVDISSPDSEESQWVPDETHPSKERAEHVATHVVENPATVRRID